MLKKCSLISLVFLLISCQVPSNLVDKKGNSFEKKAVNPSSLGKSIDDTDVGISYYGDWFYNQPSFEYDNNATPIVSKESQTTNDNSSRIDEIPSGYVAQYIPNEILSNTLTINPLDFSPSWILNSKQNILSSGLGEINFSKNDIYKTVGNVLETAIDTSNYSFITTSQPEKLVKATDKVIYINGNNSWSTSSDNSHDYNTGLPKIIDDNSPEVTYSTNSDWVTKPSGECSICTFKYNFNKDNNNFIDITFTGTNIHLYGKGGPEPGFSNLKVILDRGTVNEQIKLIDMKRVTNTNDLITKFQGLVAKTHTIRIESNSTISTQDKTSYLLAFDKALVYPSVEYNFADVNVGYRGLRNRNQGKVDIFIDGNYQQTIDMYKDIVSNFLEYVAEYSFSESKINGTNHRITIEAAGKGLNSSESIVSIDSFGSFPSAKTANKFNLSSNNETSNQIVLFVPKGPSYGKMDLYMDENGVEKFVQTINLNKNLSNYSDVVFEAEKIFIDPNQFNFTVKHYFKLVDAINKNTPDKSNVGIDGFSISQQSMIFRFRTLLNSKLKYRGLKGSSNGIVKITLKDSANQILSTHLVDLYSPVQNLVQKPITEFDLSLPTNNQPEFEGILSNQEYKIFFEPDFTKNPNSNGFSVNVDEVVLESNNTFYGEIVNSSDVVCTP